MAELGADIVYLCPVFVADEEAYTDTWSPRQKASKMNNPRNPYRMKDYYHVDAEYGTDNDLKAFIAQAHTLGMRVLLDMVYLHCGPSAVFLDEHPNFVKRDAEGKIIAADWGFPAINFDNAELREYLLNNMEYWVEDRDARYAQQRCAPAVDMPGRGQLLRTCPHPLDNPSTEPKNRGHF